MCICIYIYIYIYTYTHVWGFYDYTFTNCNVNKHIEIKCQPLIFTPLAIYFFNKSSYVLSEHIVGESRVNPHIDISVMTRALPLPTSSAGSRSRCIRTSGRTGVALQPCRSLFDGVRAFDRLLLCLRNCRVALHPFNTADSTQFVVVIVSVVTGRALLRCLSVSRTDKGTMQGPNPCLSTSKGACMISELLPQPHDMT